MTTATQTFSLSAIGQIFIRARDLDRAVHFYRDTLGMPFLFQAPPHMAFFQCGATTVMLGVPRSEEHTSELQSLTKLVCRLLLEKKNATARTHARDTTWCI